MPIYIVEQIHAFVRRGNGKLETPRTVQEFPMFLDWWSIEDLGLDGSGTGKNGVG